MASNYESAALGGDTEAVLPAQFWTPQGTGALPEKRLMAAVLEDAVALWVRAGSRPDPEILEETRAAGEWMASDDRTRTFAFASICDVLGLEPEGVRRAIRDLRRSNLDFVRPRDSSGRGRHQIREKRPRSRAA